MTLNPYREALALPGIRSLLRVAILARVPVMATGVTLTLPRRRIIEPLPAMAELVITVMPVVRPCSSWPTFAGGSTPSS